MTLHSKYRDIHMELVPPFAAITLPLFWEGFPQDFGVLLWEFLPVHPVEHL